MITRILRKYNKSLSSLISDYLNNFIQAHIHILETDQDIIDIVLTNPGLSTEGLGERLYVNTEGKVVKNYYGKPATLKAKERISDRVANVAKIVNDGGQFR